MRFVSALLTLAAPAALAGQLNPPAVPQPTPGPEPRTPLSDQTTPGDASFEFIITDPGSYYFADNHRVEPGMSGILVRSDNVTIDLCGFELRSASSLSFGLARFGILVERFPTLPPAPLEDRVGIVIRNGTVRNFSEQGLDLSESDGARVEGLTVTGCLGDGIQAGSNALVTGCVVRENSDGITTGSHSLIVDCVAEGNSGDGISAGAQSTVSRCVAADNGGRGITGDNAVNVLGCTATGNAEAGIQGFTGCVVRDSVCAANDAGIDVGQSSVVQSCTATSNTTAGIDAGPRSIVERCTVRGPTVTGITAGAAAQIIGCSVTLCTADGILATGDAVIRDNSCDGNVNSGAPLANGIRVTQQGNRIEGNHLSFNERGVVTTLSGNLIIRNTAEGLGQNHFGGVTGGNLLGTVRTDLTNAGPWDNIAYSF